MARNEKRRTLVAPKKAFKPKKEKVSVFSSIVSILFAKRHKTSKQRVPKQANAKVLGRTRSKKLNSTKPKDNFWLRHINRLLAFLYKY